MADESRIVPFTRVQTNVKVNGVVIPGAVERTEFNEERIDMPAADFDAIVAERDDLRADLRMRNRQVRDLKAELKEALAAIEHERWADWQRYLHSLCTRNPDGSLTIPAASVAHWERQIATPYADLSEREKQSDREQVDRYWPLITGQD